MAVQAYEAVFWVGFGTALSAGLQFFLADSIKAQFSCDTKGSLVAAVSSTLLGFGGAIMVAFMCNSYDAGPGQRDMAFGNGARISF